MQTSKIEITINLSVTVQEASAQEPKPDSSGRQVEESTLKAKLQAAAKLRTAQMHKAAAERRAIQLERRYRLADKLEQLFGQDMALQYLGGQPC